MKIITENFAEKVLNTLKKDKRILITGHYNPDGDAVGGALGLYNLLTNAGYYADIIMPSEYPDFLKHLPGADKIKIPETEDIEYLINSSDIIFYVDFNEEKRTEKLSDIFKKTEAVKIMLDHHPEPSEDADIIYSDTELSSASEVVYNFAELINLNKYVNKDVASCIFTGIMTDTLNFSVNSSRPETFKTAAKLLSYGIDKDYLYDKVYNSFSEKRLRLVGFSVYKKMKIFKKFKFSLILISKAELESFNFKPGDHEGIVNMPLTLKDVDISVFAVEKDDYIKISLRSKGDFDVNSLCRKYFNGGGHKNAAGGKIFRPLEEAEKYILTSFENFLKN